MSGRACWTLLRQSSAHFEGEWGMYLRDRPMGGTGFGSLLSNGGRLATS